MTRPLALALLLALFIAAPAAAQMTVEGTGEPAFTNSATNTQFFRYQGSTAYESYKARFDYTENSVAKGSETVPLSSNGGGVLWASWTGMATLVEGKTYGICGYGLATVGGVEYSDSNSCAHGAQTNKKTWTTIDRTKPSITVAIDGGAAYSRTGKLGYAISYTDNLAPPFPANFLCRAVDTDPAQACQGNLIYNPACSVPQNGTNKVNSFACLDDVSALADGPATVCIIAADAAVPDNPSNADQSGSAYNANLSSKVCDSIVIDKTAPAASIAASGTSVTVGEPVALAVQATDATSGLTGDYEWAFGDGSPAAGGAAVSHAFNTPGTFEVSVKVADAAGNQTTATKVITVAAPPAAGGTADGGTGGTGTTSGTATPGTGSPAPGTAAPGTGAPSPVAPLATLDVEAPKRLKAPVRAKALVMALTASGAGRASFALVRAGRIHSQASAQVAAGTRAFRMKLPRKLGSGTYALKVTWTPSGASAARTLTLKLVVAGPAKRARASASRAPLVDPAGAPRGLPDGRPLG